MESVVKTNFSQNLFFNDLGIDFWCFVGGLGNSFADFLTLETGLKFDGFSGESPIQGQPRL